MTSNVKSIPTVVAATPYSGHGDTTLYASPLLDSYDGRNSDGRNSNNIQQHSVYSSYDDRYRVTKARRNMFGGICCCCCTLFLLLFFLIPRSPVLTYQSAAVTTSPYQLLQTFKVTNNNPYSITLSSVNTVVSTYIYTNGPLQGETLYAFGSLQGSVDIGSLSYSNVNVAYNFTSSTPGLVAASVLQCCSGEIFVTEGTFDFSTAVALHDWHSINLQSFGVAYKCACS